MMVDHVMISIPPKYALSQVIGFIKGKNAIHIARTYLGRKMNYVGQHFWFRGYFASTVRRDEQVIREYIRHQEEEDLRLTLGTLVLKNQEPPSARRHRWRGSRGEG